MKSFNDYMNLYKGVLKEKSIQTAYKMLLGYISDMRNYFDNKYPEDYLCGHIHQGRMDNTFFTFTPVTLRKKNLKVAIVFNHADVCFEAWLVGVNKQVQATCWKELKDRNWSTYPLPVWPQDYIVRVMLVEKPDFDHTDVLTRDIETCILLFLNDIIDTFK